MTRGEFWGISSGFLGLTIIPWGWCFGTGDDFFPHWEFHIIPTEARDFSAKNHQPALRLTMAPWALISRRKRASQPLPSCWCPRSTRPGNIWESFATTKRGFCWGKRWLQMIWLGKMAIEHDLIGEHLGLAGINGCPYGNLLWFVAVCYGKTPVFEAGNVSWIIGEYPNPFNMIFSVKDYQRK